jgi:hypothetical protein
VPLPAKPLVAIKPLPASTAWGVTVAGYYLDIVFKTKTDAENKKAAEAYAAEVRCNIWMFLHKRIQARHGANWTPPGDVRLRCFTAIGPRDEQCILCDKHISRHYGGTEYRCDPRDDDTPSYKAVYEVHYDGFFLVDRCPYCGSVFDKPGVKRDGSTCRHPTRIGGPLPLDECLLHSTGRCLCAGEGTCSWCRELCDHGVPRAEGCSVCEEER